MESERDKVQRPWLLPVEVNSVELAAALCAQPPTGTPSVVRDLSATIGAQFMAAQSEHFDYSSSMAAEQGFGPSKIQITKRATAID